MKRSSRNCEMEILMAQWVYRFGDGGAGGDASMKNLLGGKGANLAEMSNLGLPVPPGFTISTEVCTYFYDHGQTYPADLTAAVDAALAHVGTLTGKKFGDSQEPLLVSVRSGARASMPGMMDTVPLRHWRGIRAMRGLLGIPIAGSSKCIRMWCLALIIIISRIFSRR
jgi:hypothetical protein